MTDPKRESITVESILAAMKELGDITSKAPRTVTMHPNDYARFVKVAMKPRERDPREEHFLFLSAFAPVSSMPVYVDDEVPEGSPEFDRPRKPIP